MNLRRIWPAAVGDVDAGQPEVSTFLEFDVAAEHRGELTDALRRSLEAEGGWDCSVASSDEMVVVFADRVFRSPRGDAARRHEVEEHARHLGLPEAQLDWRTGRRGGSGRVRALDRVGADARARAGRR